LHANNIVSSANSSPKSWFYRLRDFSLEFGLPHPRAWLSTKPSKLQVKSMSKAAVVQFWLAKIRAQADSLTSLLYFKTRFRCHPMITSCASSPWEVEKATSQSRLLLGRYRVESLTGQWNLGTGRDSVLCHSAWPPQRLTMELWSLSCSPAPLCLPPDRPWLSISRTISL